MLREGDRHTHARAGLSNDVPLVGGVVGEDVDRDDDGQPEGLEVLDMFEQVAHAGLQGRDVRLGEVGRLGAAVVLQGPDRGDEHRGVRVQPGFAAFDVHEFFRARSAPKPASVTV